jgi:hypothetical protein
MDFEIGLKHEAIKNEILVGAEVPPRGLLHPGSRRSVQRSFLKEIADQFPGYKDVPNLNSRYGELNTNRNLQTYLMSATSDFVTICRKIATSFFHGAKVKITESRSTIT